MFENVLDLGLVSARAYNERGSTKRILVHFSQTTGNLETAKIIHKNHIARGWAGAAYNIFVAEDGRMCLGRGLQYAGGSVNGSEPETAGMNSSSIAVCFLGDFTVNEMPEAQKQAGIKLLQDLREYYGDIPIVYHKEAARPGYTDCPGRLFPTEEIRNAAYNGTQVDTPITPAPADPPTAPIPKGTILYFGLAVRGSGTNFRTGAGLDKSVIRTMNAGDKGRFKGVSGDWYKIRINGADGWIRKDKLKNAFVAFGYSYTVMVQKRLRTLGLYAGEVDDIYGIKTAIAVGAFQSSCGLNDDCIAGDDTLQCLFT